LTTNIFRGNIYTGKAKNYFPTQTDTTCHHGSKYSATDGGTITKTEFISARRGRLLRGVETVFRKWLFAMEVLEAFLAQKHLQVKVFDLDLRL